MTSSRFLTGLLVIAVAPLALASGPVEAQVSNYADGAVTIDMGALPMAADCACRAPIVRPPSFSWRRRNPPPSASCG